MGYTIAAIGLWLSWRIYRSIVRARCRTYGHRWTAASKNVKCKRFGCGRKFNQFNEVKPARRVDWW